MAAADFQELRVVCESIETFDTALIGLAGVLIGGLITFLATRLQISHQDRLDKRERLLQKFERISMLFSEHSIQATKLLGLVARFFIDGTKVDAAGPPDRPPKAELTMLARFYAPALLPVVEEMSARWQDLAIALVQADRANVTADANLRDKALEDFERAAIAVGLLAEQGQAKLVPLVEELDIPPTGAPSSLKDKK